jgi:hypothetical protein
MIADGRGVEATPGLKLVIGCEQRNRPVAFRPAATPLRGGVSGCRGSPG